ncbi:hypothetical protein MP228_004990 [Amoeboaphelidium protococcarum]|nr:hypothetical protein MP228_013038 [Amoeboaphelidium protococcarum]KAI3644606.1 hypothetical protein MP228_010770 [Amoeboaphelidium protococcarum]KAI3650157.1 hypothetical protein MP228_004990 [Amoeboaphelidium protococcarum]
MATPLGQNQEKTRRIAVVGSRAVGKSSLTLQFVENRFVQDYYPTIENTFSKKFVLQKSALQRQRGPQTYNLEVIDTAGQDEYTLMSSTHNFGIHGYVLVYSIANRESFELLNVIRDKVLNFGSNSVAFCIVGNKCDLESNRKVTKQQGEQLASQWGCAFVEASAKGDINVDRAFEMVLREIEKSDVGGSSTGNISTSKNGSKDGSSQCTIC